MRDIGILFQTPMVKAILEGRKTQTRRILKPQPLYVETASVRDADTWQIMKNNGRYFVAAHPLPFRLGDSLWVRENFYLPVTMNSLKPSEVETRPGENPDIHYEADGRSPGWAGKFRTARFMPKALSRIRLKVTNLKIEELNAISDDDAIAEGIDVCGQHNRASAWKDYQGARGFFYVPRNSFHSLWEKIHGDGRWTENPWVLAITFEVVQKERQP